MGQQTPKPKPGPNEPQQPDDPNQPNPPTRLGRLLDRHGPLWYNAAHA